MTPRPALLHLVWINQDGNRQLVFGNVELFPDGYPYQHGHPFIAHKVSESPSVTVFIARFPMNIPEAEAWYQSAATGKIILPAHPDKATKGDGASIDAGSLVAEPPDGAECVGIALPFVATLHAGANVCGLFGPPNVTLQKIIFDPKVLEWTTENLHFSFKAFPEYLGAIFRVRYNQVVRYIDRKFSPRPDGGEDELIRIDTWPSASLDGCELLVVDRRPFGLAPIYREAITSSVISIPWPRKIEHTGLAIVHKTEGLYWWCEPLPYTRAMMLNTNVISTTKSVEVWDDKTLKDKYEVHESNSVLNSRTVVGERQDTRSIASRFYAARHERKQQQLRDQLGVRWFDDPAIAAKEIRSIVTRAIDYVWIVDPYFAGSDLFRFAIAVPGNVPVDILTSAMALEREHKKGSGYRFSDQLRRALDEALSGNAHQNLSAHVMVGKRPPLHDRFLVVDGRLWLSGNSLNSIGELASVLVEVPMPADILEKIVATRNDAQPFDSWYTRHVAQRPALTKLSIWKQAINWFGRLLSSRK